MWDLWVAAVPFQRRSWAGTDSCERMPFRNARRQLPPPAQQQLPLEAAHLPKSDDASAEETDLILLSYVDQLLLKAITCL